MNREYDEKEIRIKITSIEQEREANKLIPELQKKGFTLYANYGGLCSIRLNPNETLR